MKPRMLRIVIVLTAAAAVGAIAWVARSAPPSTEPSSMHARALDTNVVSTTGSPAPAQDPAGDSVLSLGLVVEVRGGEAPVLVIDTVQLLPADEKTDPSAEAQLINEKDDRVSIPIAEDVVIESANGEMVSLKDWYASVTTQFVAGRDIAVWVTVSGGSAKRIEEQLVE